MAEATSIVVQPGVPLYLNTSQRVFGPALSLTCVPGAGATMHVYASNTPGAAALGETGVTWTEAEQGAMTNPTEVVRFSKCQAIKVTSTSGAASKVEVSP